jgi:hypothetical protein
MRQSSTPAPPADAVTATTDPATPAVVGWTCLACRWVNVSTVAPCGGCGRRFADQFETARPAMSPRLHAIAVGAREFGLVFVLFVAWRLATGFSLTHGTGAIARGRDLWNLERRLRLPSEAWVQRGVIAHPIVVQSLDVFYLAAHVGGLAIFLGWLFLRHRDSYNRWRNVVVAFTAIALAIQLVSIAPPRLVPGLGLVDTAARYHQSAYAGPGSSFTDQLSTMPSIHVGWALIVALAVITASTSRYRWWIVLHPVVTIYVVVATANHFWLDAVAAAAIVGVVLGLERVVSRCRSGHAPSHRR